MFRPFRYAPGFLLAGVLAATPACATGYYQYPRGDSYRDVERRAYDNGFREGLKQGERDARRGRPFEVQRHDEWRDADDGYHRDYGDREFYRRGYRQGFETGYRETFNRYARGGYYGTPAPYGYPNRGPAISGPTPYASSP